MLNIINVDSHGYDALALGEVMLRFDPGDERVRQARQFRVWEGGGEYNVVRGLRKCFGLRTAIATALPKSELGFLAEDLIMQGGVDTQYIVWRDFDGLGKNTRMGLNFTERGFGLRPPMGCSDRAHSAAAQIRQGEFDWEKIFARNSQQGGVRWFHTGGIFAALSDDTAKVTIEAMKAAKKHGVIVSYDMNYRPSLWMGRGGKPAADALNEKLAHCVDVLMGFDWADDETPANSDPQQEQEKMLRKVRGRFPQVKVAAATIRHAMSATQNDWRGLLLHGDDVFVSREYRRLEVLDRVGGGDAFASGIIYGYLTGATPQHTIDLALSHGILAMTTPGDNSMARLSEVEALLSQKPILANR